MPSAANVGMRSWLLTFRDENLESAYERYALENWNRLGDLRFFFVSTIVLFSISMKAMLDQDYDIFPGVPHFLTGVLTALMWRLYLRSPTEHILQMRPYMSVIFRIAIALAGSVTSHYTAWLFALVPNTIAVIVQFLMATETFGNIPYAFGLTLKFKYHLPTQIVAYLIFLFGKAAVTCEEISSSRGASIFYKIDAAVDFFFEFCFSFLGSTVGSFDIKPSVKTPCLHLCIFLMTFFSMGCISFIIWNTEKSTRIQFLVAQRQRESTSLTRPAAPMSLRHETDCVFYLILLSSAVLYWRWSTSLTTFVMQQTH